MASFIEENGADTVGARVKTPPAGCARHSRRAGRRLRWTPFDGARKSGICEPRCGDRVDVLWVRITRKASDAADTFGHVEAGRFMIMLDRGETWQCAYLIRKGGIDRMKIEGLEAFRKRLLDIWPFLSDRVGELKSWDDVKRSASLSLGCGNGGGLGSFASAMRRMRCTDWRGGNESGGAGRGRRRRPVRGPAPQRQGDGYESRGDRIAAPCRYT